MIATVPARDWRDAQVRKIVRYAKGAYRCENHPRLEFETRDAAYDHALHHARGVPPRPST